MHILVVEDEEGITRFIKRRLEAERFAVDVAHDGEKGFYFAKINEYDVIILDIMLPKMDGIEICHKLRKRKKRNADTPIIMLTAKSDIESKTRAFSQGADDYLVKPFAFDELLARIRSLLRRGNAYKEDKLVFGDLTLDPSAYKVERAGRAIKLTRKEFSLLEFLMKNSKTVLRRDTILEHVWDYHADILTNTVDAHIAFLRKKIDAGHKLKLIRTVHGVGYKLDNQD